MPNNKLFKDGINLVIFKIENINMIKIYAKYHDFNDNIIWFLKIYDIK